MTNPHIVDVDESTFDYQVLAYSQKKPVIVDFWAEWCDPCHRITPLLERIALQKQGSFRLAKVNADENTQLTKRYNVNALPSLKAFQSGQVIGDLRGVQGDQQIREFVRQVVPSPDDLLMDKAVSTFHKEKYRESEDVCRDILDTQPGHPRATLVLVKSLLAQGESGEASVMLSQFPASPQYKQAETLRPLAGAMESIRGRDMDGEAQIDAVYGRALRLINMGNLPAALDGLIDVLRKNKQYREGEAKKVILGIFELLGDHHPLTKEYRKKLANILF